MYTKFPIPTKFMFFKLPGESGHAYKFSSVLEKIGIEWDVSIQNGTYVDVISDPVEIKDSPYGDITVVKIRADVATDYHTIIKEFWVPVDCIIDMVQEKANKAVESILKG
jgi:hypothetical protein